MGTYTALAVSCDAPDCTKVITGGDGESESQIVADAGWINGTVLDDTEWVACRRTHIRGAVEAVLDGPQQQPTGSDS